MAPMSTPFSQQNHEHQRYTTSLFFENLKSNQQKYPQEEPLLYCKQARTNTGMKTHTQWETAFTKDTEAKF